MGQGGHVPQYLYREWTLSRVFPNIWGVKSSLFVDFTAFISLKRTFYVNIDKEASASGGLRPPNPLPWLCPWILLGDFRSLDPLLCPPTMETDRRRWITHRVKSRHISVVAMRSPFCRSTRRSMKKLRHCHPIYTFSVSTALRKRKLKRAAMLSEM